MLRASLVIPLLLTDSSLACFLNRNSAIDKYYQISPNSFLLAMEYRAIHNYVLNNLNKVDVIMSDLCIGEVYLLLAAFLVQGRKDFELYGITDRNCSYQSKEYYLRCFQALGISEETYRVTKRKLVTSVYGDNGYADCDARNVCIRYKKLF